MKIIVRNITMVKIEKNPKTKDKISVFFLSNNIYPINKGMTGKMHGEITEAIPAKNENKGTISI